MAPFRAEERAKRAAQRRVKWQPVQASSAAEPPAAGEARPAQPGSGRPIRRRNSVVLPTTPEPPPAREGFSGFLDRKDAERAGRVGAPPQGSPLTASSSLASGSCNRCSLRR